jgi:hypothetical protein
MAHVGMCPLLIRRTPPGFAVPFSCHLLSVNDVTGWGGGWRCPHLNKLHAQLKMH